MAGCVAPVHSVRREGWPGGGVSDRLLTVRDVAQLLQVDPKTVRRLDIPFVPLAMGEKRARTTRRYVAADVEAWIAAHRRAA